jgi:hypothetical protein
VNAFNSGNNELSRLKKNVKPSALLDVRQLWKLKKQRLQIQPLILLLPPKREQRLKS